MLTLSRIRRILMLIALILLALSYWQKNNYRSVSDIDTAVNEEPKQKELEDKTPIVFDKDGYRYVLEPLFDYELNALVVHEMSYDVWYSLSNYDTVFPKDVCALWGKNVSQKWYQSRGLKFSQDYRFCLYRYNSGVAFDTEGISNTHLIVKSPDMIEKIKKVKASDQVKIKGKLVNVNAKFIGGEKKQFDFDEFSMNSSVTRNDSGAGACEIVYVEKMEITKTGNPLWKKIFAASQIIIGAIFLWGFIQFIWEVFINPKVIDDVV